MEPFNSNCGYDKVEIYDGADENARKIGRFCDRAFPGYPGEIYSTGNKLYVKFKTDGSTTKKGFAARFSSIEPAPAGKEFCLSLITRTVIHHPVVTRREINGN